MKGEKKSYGNSMNLDGGGEVIESPPQAVIVVLKDFSSL